MKKLLGISGAVLGLLGFAATAQAQTITSIQFIGPYNGGTPLTPSAVAGVESVDNWNSTTNNGYTITGSSGYNNYHYDSNSTSLITSTGAASSVTYSIGSYGNQGYGTGTYTNPNNGVLMNGGAMTSGTGATNNLGNGPFDTGNNPVDLTLAGLNTNDVYSFYVYVGGASNELAEGSISLVGGNTYYFGSTNGGYGNPYASTLINHASLNDDPVADAGGSGTSFSNLTPYDSNYVLFSGITGVTSVEFNLTELGTYPNGTFIPAALGGNVNLGIAGVQIVDVPEPTTVWLFALGFAGLVFQIQRKRLAKL